MAEGEAKCVTYFGLVERVPGQHFAIRFPDFPDCVIRRDAIDQALGRASEAIRSRVDSLVRIGKPLPRPTPLETIKDDPANRSSFLFRFEVEIPQGSSVEAKSSG